MSNYPEADEAQHGHCNDGFDPYATQPTAMNAPSPRSSSYVPAPPHDPYHQQQPQMVSRFGEAYPAIPPGLSLPINDHIGTLHNPHEEQRLSIPGSPPQTQFGLASQSGQADNTGIGDTPLLHRDSLNSFAAPQGGCAPGASDVPPEANIWHGIPQRAPRRNKTLKTVELLRGNFVLDSAVPSKFLDSCALRSGREFTHMRYSAATCDPNDFEKSGFTLRQTYYDPPRQTELFIVVTMYNETDKLFCQSMRGVIKNIAHLCKRGRSKMWGKEGWKKVVVCIVADGRQKINLRTLSVLTTMGVYQEGIAKNVINGRPVTAHIYEYTTQISDLSPLKLGKKDRCPVQLIFCLKEKNQKKINSHRWFFNAFGPLLKPNVCMLLDVGTVPGPSSVYHLWKAFDVDDDVGGACGEIVAYKGKYGEYLLNPLVAAQNFEYKMSNILDKPLESVFGYITVLPGAFSAYRYIALKNNEMGKGPLEKYFLGETMHGAGANIFTANMYLAEDRILCWELVSKWKAKWTLHYVKSAYAITDVPDKVPELISQRRRWLNGSFFAAVHSIVHFYNIYRSSHSFFRKFWIHFEMLYQFYNLIFSWFALGNYYIIFVILTNALEDYLPVVHYPNLILNYFYLGLLVMCFLLSLGNRPQGAKWAYTLALLGFGLITIYMTASAFLLAYKGVEPIVQSQSGVVKFVLRDFLVDSIFRNIVLSLAATLGLYTVSSLLFFEPWHMVTSFLQYLLMAPSYIAVLNVYAFSNIHDVSWGTKGDNKVSTDLGVVSVGKGANEGKVEVLEEKDINTAYEEALVLLSKEPPKEKEAVDPTTQQEDYYKTFRTNLLLVWTLSNGLLAAVVVSAMPDRGSRITSRFVNIYMSVILFSITGLAFVRFLGSTIYLIIRLFARE